MIVKIVCKDVFLINKYNTSAYTDKVIVFAEVL